MFKDLTKILISGGAFTEERFPKGAELQILQNRLNLIYGRNGCGKSTIASAIKNWKENQPDDVTVSFVPPLDDSAKEMIHIFNEDFIQKNILERSKGPETIMMIGSGNVNATKRIEELEEKIKGLNNEIGEVDKEITALENKKNDDSKEAAYNSVKDVLAADDGFAVRATLIKIHSTTLNGKNKARINEDVIDSVRNAGLNPPASFPSTKDELKKYISDKLAILSSVSGNQVKLYWTYPQITVPFDSATVNGLLGKIVEKPTLSEREQKIFSLLEESERTNYLKLARKDIIDSNVEYCPLCHQPIGAEASRSLAETVSKLLGDEVGRFDGEISRAIDAIFPVSVSFPSFPNDLYSDDIKECQGHLYKINDIIEKTKAALSRKRDKKYGNEPFRVDVSSLNRTLEQISDSLKRIAKDVSDYNSLIDDTKALEKAAETANLLLGYLEAKSQIEKFYDSKDLYEKALIKKSALTEERNLYAKEANSLGQQMKQTATAHDYINRQLKNIFYSSDRLSLKGSEDGSYILCSRGKSVPPGKLSTGERNIIALTYFFATLFSGKTQSAKYSSPLLVVIDDPVSSFDFGNRAGITSFLSSELSTILKGNADSKVLLFSHDMHTISDLSKVAKNINGKKIIDGKDTVPLFQELADGKLKGFSRNDNEYWKLLQDIYYYATKDSPSDSEETGIGNKMRRALETYSTFMFQCGFKDMLDKDYICDSIPPTCRDYYKNFLGRFLFDALSHAENQVNSLDFTESLFSHQEKQSNAKNLLKFLYHTNSNHLRAYLREEQYDIVQSWADS